MQWHLVLRNYQKCRAGYYPPLVEDPEEVQLQSPKKSPEGVRETLRCVLLLLGPILVSRDHPKGREGYCSALIQVRKESYVQCRKENPEVVRQDPRRGLLRLGPFLKQGRLRGCPLSPY